MPAPNRLSILISAALAIVTPFVAGLTAWSYLDAERRFGLVYWLLYWPLVLIDQLPARVSEALDVSALPAVLMYFGGYLLLCQLARSLWRRLR